MTFAQSGSEKSGCLTISQLVFPSERILSAGFPSRSGPALTEDDERPSPDITARPVVHCPPRHSFGGIGLTAGRPAHGPGSGGANPSCCLPFYKHECAEGGWWAALVDRNKHLVESGLCKRWRVVSRPVQALTPSPRTARGDALFLCSGPNGVRPAAVGYMPVRVRSAQALVSPLALTWGSAPSAAWTPPGWKTHVPQRGQSDLRSGVESRHAHRGQSDCSTQSGRQAIVASSPGRNAELAVERLNPKPRRSSDRPAQNPSCLP